MKIFKDLKEKIDAKNPTIIPSIYLGFMVGVLITVLTGVISYYSFNVKRDVKVGDCYIRLGDYYKVVKKGKHSLLLEEYEIYSHYYRLNNKVVKFKELEDDYYKKIDCEFIKLPKDRL